jgi:CRISPR system Cascade subunit CasC
MFIELHIIQNFPPSNLNRDDLGQPKTTDFGGYRRARISSQCIKRAIRYAGRNLATGTKPIFERYTGVPLGKRTKLIVEALVKHLVAFGKDEEIATRIAHFIAEAYAGSMDRRRKEETAVLLYLSDGKDGEITWIAERLVESWDEFIAYLDEYAQWEVKAKEAQADKKKAPAEPKCQIADDVVNQLIQETYQRTSAPDIALFGRMLADKPKTNIDAACQVAHPISTHAIDGRTPIDYFTAVDDIKTDPGAGFLDVAYFNSACFYRYARIDFEQLKKNLGGNHDMACRSVEAFLRASEAAIPSGKKNAYAQECRPAFMLAVLRSKESEGWSLVNAFQKPVNAQSEEDLVVASVQRLEKHYEHLINFYDDDTVKTLAVALPDGTVEADHLHDRFQSEVKNMQGWIDAICEPLRQGA